MNTSLLFWLVLSPSFLFEGISFVPAFPLSPPPPRFLSSFHPCFTYSSLCFFRMVDSIYSPKQNFVVSCYVNSLCLQLLNLLFFLPKWVSFPDFFLFRNSSRCPFIIFEVNKAPPKILPPISLFLCLIYVSSCCLSTCHT